MTYPEFIAEWNDNNPEIEVHTSGSTGTPKRILLSKDIVRESALRTIRHFHIDSNSRLHSCISPDFIGGKMVAVRSIVANCRFSFENPSNEPIIPNSAEDPVDMVSVVPSQMIYIVDHAEDFRHIRHFLIGGAPLPYGLEKRIVSCGLNAWLSYGMTETASHVAVRKVGDAETGFTPLPGISLDTDDRGCLVISGATPTPVVTNDIARLDSSTGRFSILGRADNVIITGGKKVHPEMIEDKIRRILNFEAPIMVVGVPDQKWGERVVLYIEGIALSNVEAKRIMADMRQSLEGWECPKEIRVVDMFARTPNGKLLRSIHK